MRFLAVYITALLTVQLIGLSCNIAVAAPNKKQAQKHSHNRRVHTHILPASGIKHFHKHEHNGRAHIHPYSVKVGFKHSHNLSPRAKAWANAVKHEHAGRQHSHPLPRTGVKHQHSHKHGGRSHIHPFPVTGVKHFHRLNKGIANPNPIINNNKKTSQNEKPRTIRGVNIKQPINIKNQKYSALLNNKIGVSRPVQARKSQSKISEIDKSTIKKVLAYGHHRHEGRAHQHSLPATGIKHAHKHAHDGRVHSHLIPVSNTAHSHTNKSKTRSKKTNKRVLTKQRPQNINKIRKVKKAQLNSRKVAVRKRPPTSIKPKVRRVKRTPEQIADGNRQFSLALRYENGTGVKKNLPQAVNWYLRSAKNGNAKAQFNLASLYESGDGVKRNIPEAIRLYTNAANNGDVNAQVNLGNQYARGINIPKNINEATKWYKRAADQGDMRGRANLNYLINSNNGVIKR